MICEVGLENHYQCQIVSRKKNKAVMFAQTNHYIHDIHDNHVKYNLTSVLNQQTSYQRLIKINALMNKNSDRLDFQH